MNRRLATGLGTLAALVAAACGSETPDPPRAPSPPLEAPIEAPFAEPPPPPPPEREIEPESPVRFTVRVAGDRQRIYHEPDGAPSVLVRNERAEAPPTSATIEAREVEPFARWQAAVQRMSDPDWEIAEVRHDALLDVAERLENALEQDPTHLGVLRDLIEAYVGLLAFERRSGLGANVCVLASERLDEFTVRAAPLDESDRAWAGSMRAWMHFFMRQYPLAARDADASLRGVLEGLGQMEFFEVGQFDVGPLRARVVRTLAAPPDPKLLWPEWHVWMQRDDEAPPHQIVAYSLSRRGPSGDTRWYLHMHALNRSALVAAYGKTRPPIQDALARVRAHAARGLEAAEARSQR